MKTKAKTEEAPPKLTPPAPERFNETWLAKVKVVPPHREGEAFDGHIAGLGLRVYATGVKSFYFKNNRFRDPIGRWPGVTLQAARKAAEARNGKIALGIDLVEEREKAIAKKNVPKAITLKELVELNKTTHLITKSAAHRARSPRTVEMTFPALMKTPVTQLAGRAADIEAAMAVARETRGRSTARAAGTNLRSLLNWAVKKRFITRAQLPEFEVPTTAPSRMRVLTEDELARIFEVARGPRGAIGRLIMLSGARRTEIARLEWSELHDLDNPALARIALPRERTKVREPHITPLSSAALDVIRGIPRVEGQRFVFPGRRRSHAGEEVAFDDFHRLKAEIVAALGEPALPDWTWHDLRRSMVTHLSGESYGYDSVMLDRLLGHTPTGLKGSAGVYQLQKHLPERRRALEAWARLLTRQPAEVIELPARRRAAQ